jgi:hypothetical protein
MLTTRLNEVRGASKDGDHRKHIESRHSVFKSIPIYKSPRQVWATLRECSGMTERQNRVADSNGKHTEAASSK